MTRTTAGGAIFSRLKKLGVTHVFANSGTDFPPIIEGLAAAEAAGVDLPVALTIPHEHVAMGMAHGAWLATGGLQAVILHTNVGLANGAIGAINAAVDQVPVILMSGRTPTVEAGRFGARTVPIGWGQEMRDQTALVREASKWDYELRFPEQIEHLLDRAAAISQSTPSGPTYLSLPREVLCEEIDLSDARPSMRPTRARAAAEDIEAAAATLAAAKRPLIVAQRGAGPHEGWDALSRIAADWAIPVSDWWAVANAVSQDHPSYVGPDVGPWLAEADVALVIDSLAPWGPDMHAAPEGLRIIQLGPDPLMARTPVRMFRADHALATETGPGLVALEAALTPLRDGAAGRIADRRGALEAKAAEIQAAHRAMGEISPGQPMTKAHVAMRIGEAIRDHDDATVLSELGVPLAPLGLTKPGQWRQEPHAGGLGWSFPAALGMKLAAPGRTVIATMGDGSYMFANPVACHQVAEAYGIGVVVVIVNNSEWGAVRMSVAGLYPDGAAAKANRMPLTALAPAPDYAAVARASRAHAETVERAEDLPAALDRAIEAAEAGRCALLDVKVAAG